MPTLNNLNVVFIRDRDGNFTPVNGLIGSPGRGIVSIERTSGDGTSGSIDVYTITYTDKTTSTFEVYNGSDGESGATPEQIAAAIEQYLSENPFVKKETDPTVFRWAKAELFDKNDLVDPAGRNSFVTIDDIEYYRYNASAQNFEWNNPNPQTGSVAITARGVSQYGGTGSTRLRTFFDDGTEGEPLFIIVNGESRTVTYTTPSDKVLAKITGNYDMENWILLDMSVMSCLADYPAPTGTVKSVNGNLPDENGNVEIPSGGGSGTDIALGITGAAVGQIAKIKAVDASGAPTEWETEKDTTPFIVTVGGDNVNGYTSSHTFDEIAAAASAGRVVMAYTDYIYFPGENQSLYGTYFDLISTQDVAIFRYTDGLLEYHVFVSPSETSASAGYLSATSSSFGGIKADSAETTDTQPVRIGEDGKLYTAPGSGGGDGTWRTIAEIQTDGTVNQYEITQDADGNPLNLTEMIIRYVGLKGETVNTYQAVWINDVQVSYRHALTTTSATKYETFWMRKTGKYIYGICNEATKDGISGMNTSWRAGGIYLSREIFPNDEVIQKIKLGNSSGADTNYLNGITITILGK